ncbi:MAG: hypothetical protein LBK08_10885 [Treponema sp.]|jgi:hypothetical protein|nr:hypothetical protein [Treponema sp.]
MKKKIRFFCLFFALFASSVFFPSCNNGGGSPPSLFVPLTYTQTVHLENQSLYLVKVNRSDGEVGYNNAGRASSVNSPAMAIPLDISASGAPDGEAAFRRDHEGARRFNSNPPPIPPEQPSRRGLLRSSPVVGTSRLFWVDDVHGNFSQINATLRKQSVHANVWVPDANYDDPSSNKTNGIITQIRAENIANKFDEIYGHVTGIFGYEYGAASGQPPLGGKDGDERVQILIYDIDLDYVKGGTVGYFWAKDYYEQSYLDATYGNGKLQTNLSEIFYLDSWWADERCGVALSTLVHEFQHMVHFNEKFVRKGKNSATWYNEMLSMLAEDMISSKPEIGVTDIEDLPAYRLHQFIYTYREGVTSWFSGDNALISYANSYAFGAYLARNFGGEALVRAMAANDAVNKESVSMALASVSPVSDVKNFDGALRRFAEVLLYNDTSGSRSSLNKTTGGTYAFSGINIMPLSRSTFYTYSPAGIAFNPGGNGPLIFSLDYLISMPPNSALVQTCSAWQNVSGNVTVTFTVPLSPYVEQYLLVR